jgi:NAD(P)H-nitrite reductase large subunit
VEVAGDGRVRRVVLEDHTTLDSEIVVACAGIRPNADLARRAGLAVNRGVVVDDTMLTSAPGVFAAGDVAECDGQVLGLWPVAVEQAQVAGVNATGGGRRHAFSLPAAILKGVGVDVVAAGRIEPRPGDEVICIDDPAAPSYAKLVMSNGRVVGGLSFGRPLDGAAVLAAVRRSADVTDVVPVLREGNFEALASCAAAGNDQSANPAPRPPAAGWTERRPSAHDGRGRSRFDWSLPLGGKLRGHDPR